MTPGNSGEVADLCSRLVTTRSCSGEEEALVREVRTFWESRGCGDFRIDENGSFVAAIKGNRPGPVLLFDAHIDTVDADESHWTESPWSGVVRDGKVFGRGSSDMKGALSAMLCAAIRFRDDRKEQFPGEIHISGVVHEECFEGVSARLISTAVKPDLVIIGEASELNVNIGQRGRAEMVLETFGESAHSANPEKGKNAVDSMLSLLPEIRALPEPCDDALGRGILEITDIKSSPYPGSSVVPHHCRVTFDRRLLRGERKDDVLRPIQQQIKARQKEDPDFKGGISFALAEEPCWTGHTIRGERFFPGWYFSPEEDFVRRVMEGLRDAGLNPGIGTYSFCTNGSHYAGEASIPTVGFGPSREDLAHTDDEYVEIDQLEGAYRGYLGIMNTFLTEA